MNQVQKISFIFSGEKESFFRSLYADWEMHWIPLIEKSVERILEKYNDISMIIELDSLSVDTGKIYESDFKETFLSVFEEHLENELLRKLYPTSSSEKSVRKSVISHLLPELLFYFLIHGTLPWNTSLKDKNINKLFLEIAKNNSSELVKFFQRFGHYTSLQKRLVFQLDDNSLLEGIKLLKPGESHFIISYVKFLYSKYQKTVAPTIPQTSYRIIIWEVIYAWLLTNRSSFFNKKSFLQQTIQQFSANYRITYSELLQMLLAEYQGTVAYASELLILLNTLNNENSNAIKNRFSYWSVLEKLMILINNKQLHKKEQKELIEQVTAQLISQKSKRYLKLLKETEILKIVEVLLPLHSRFIKTYAKILEVHKEKGMLEGKAGGEFKIIKWEIMFSLLFSNRGFGFNRHYFVLGVLQRIAAHYNITIKAILKFVQQNESIKYIDTALHNIFNALYLQFNDNGENLPAERLQLNVEQIIQHLKAYNWLNAEQQQKWNNYLRSQSVVNQLLEKISENEYHQLIRILYSAESELIISYSKAIDQQEHRGEFQGKTSGNFSKIKKYFIFSVLQEFRTQGFNKQLFVERVLRKLAARYNLKMSELISIFYLDFQKKDKELPFELYQILQKLYVKNLSGTLKSTDQDAKKQMERTEKTQRLLIHYFGNNDRYILLIKKLSLQADFVFFIESVLQIHVQIYRFLLSEWNITIDNRKVLLILLRFSKEYTSLSKAEILLKLISWTFLQLQTQVQRTGLKKYIKEITVTETELKKTFAILSDFSDRQLNEENLLNLCLDDNIQEENKQLISFINNAGLLILTPFLPRLFTLLELTLNGKFINKDAQIKAIFLIQFAIFGTTEFFEYELELNKLLTGFKIGEPLPRSVDLTEEEINITERMLQGVVQHWDKVKTIDGLREGFLQREGKLEEKGEEVKLTVENKAYDILLDTIPWNFRTIRFSWMEKTVQVKWR